MITTEQVKELRDATGISVMQCRKALEEAGGDMKKALAILKKTSAEIALKKADREVKDGRIAIKQNGNKAVLVTLQCETDFVARNEDFVNLIEALANKANTEGVESMKAGAKEMIDPVIQKTGENITLGESYEVEGPVLGYYVHNNKSAVIVTLNGGNSDLAKDVAMHVAAMRPEYVTQSDIDEDAKKTMMEVFEKEVANVDKPEEIKKKMLEGKISTYFKEKTLVDQPFIKNGDQTVGKLLEANKATIAGVKKYSI
jgi:elongation factor Ts